MSPKNELAITEPVFASYLDCTYKAFLRLHARKGQQTLLEKHSVEFDTDYQTRAITQLLAAYAPEKVNRQRILNKSVALAERHLLLVDRGGTSTSTPSAQPIPDTASSTSVRKRTLRLSRRSCASSISTFAMSTTASPTRRRSALL